MLCRVATSSPSPPTAGAGVLACVHGTGVGAMSDDRWDRVNLKGKYDEKKQRRFMRGLVYLSLFFYAGALLGGCQTREKPLSPAAAAFKKEVQGSIEMLSQVLIAPLQQKDFSAIHQALQEHTPEALKLCRLCPFMLAVLDLDGVTLAVYPPRDHNKNYSQYKAVTKALTEGRIGQAKLFLPDGSQLFMICAPLRKERETQGLVVFIARPKEIAEKYGLSEHEFFALDFNS